MEAHHPKPYIFSNILNICEVLDINIEEDKVKLLFEYVTKY